MTEMRFGVGEHPQAVRKLVQPAGRHRSQGAAVAQATAGDQQDATVAALLRKGKKGRQSLMSLSLAEAVQVKPRFNGVESPPQLEPSAPIQVDRPERVEPSRADAWGGGTRARSLHDVRRRC